ncbi:MAG: hypothetical protein OXB97_08550 [Rhodospirillales bacterium]|nr:hypothetical protein [Rhodospirillales bacterium]
MTDAELFGNAWQCGRPVACGKGPYCEEHAARAFTVTPDERAANQAIREAAVAAGAPGAWSIR